MNTGRPALTNLSVDELCAIAGGDPWKINDELQAGDAGAIDALADAFHQAGFHVKESDDEFTTAKKQFTDAWHRNGSEHPINESDQVQKATAALHGHQDQLSKIAVGLEQIAASLAIAQRTSDAEVAGANRDLEAIDNQISAAKAANQNWLELELQAAGVVKGALGHVEEARGGYLAQLHGAETAMAAAGYTPDAIDSVDGAPAPADTHIQNQIDAFRKVFGRDPVSQSDWTTASVLDPHSYDTKYQGAPPNITVGRVKPVPGQGVVRTNLFIPGEKAWSPAGDNLGDNRGFNTKAGPEESRVTIYTDYDNGIVVARQNPSVLQGSSGAEVKAGHPDIQVSQNPNGSVHIRYHAADPFSPGGEDLAKSTPWNVNGEYVIKPTSTGPIVGGTISDFPAVEIYNDRGGHTTDLGHIMPQNTSVFGPLAGLPLAQDFGPGLMGEFPDTMVSGSSALPAMSLPGSVTHAPPVLRPSVPVVIPYPSVTLGSVDSIPHIPIGS